MRVWIACLFVLLVSTFGTASPAFAAAAKNPHFSVATVTATPEIGQHGRGQHRVQLGDADVIVTACSQPTTCFPVEPAFIQGLKALIYPADAACFPPGRDNACIQPFYRLILFPFHVFW